MFYKVLKTPNNLTTHLKGLNLINSTNELKNTTFPSGEIKKHLT
ncbi:hypothetical protein [Coxiella burnetii]|uniref:Uncharacterized protein n=2 Tax=Coxiella burnetii TaxID=777 RepID=Q83F30_COXBU|nr:hypothetical protein [Coxiella burnetii]NP_819171.1 hypothetical protein CBU_0121 [Coxiella burnetii RSA 493]AAO89685.1 hypothetical protein CBU_0121 [Coxiella burnetii RSA 493]ABS78208.1 hypothetical protein CBUD_1985 [Coxiella burnetii Dugway 5J108-111]ABX77300.1 hypothetical protein COXBURSA331_A0211 [Coxiella burnetii RSA 331]ACJ19140.1 hypothetical protein CbuG_1892 [Coxiella burnetii CbuG_Q212]ACJ21039.1 hypothetical protein CbuK_1930 [Coxiella burnetii CbuK_Q154]